MAGAVSAASCEQVIGADFASYRLEDCPAKDESRCGEFCAKLGTDPANCGSCGNYCFGINGEATCVSGRCEVVSCDADWGDCNTQADDGCEAYLPEDPANCGGCGASCVPGQCFERRCFTAPDVIASGQGEPQQLALDDLHVYWVNAADQTLVRSLKAPHAEPEVLATGVVTSTNILVDGSSVYWADSDAIKKVAVTGGPTVLVLSTTFGISSLAADDTYLYWAESGEVWRADKSGQGPLELGSTPMAIDELALTLPDVYFTAYQSVVRVAKNGGQVPEVLVSGLTDPRGIAVAGSSVFFTETVAGNCMDMIKRLDLAGGTTTDFAEHVCYPLDLLTTGGRVVWSDFGGVWVAPMNGGPAERIALTQPEHMAADADHVYWTYNDAVERFALP